MRKFICVLVALLICASAALPVLAAPGEFVPSIEYKDGPTVVGGSTSDGTDISDKITINTIEGALKGDSDMSDEDREALLEVYEDLKQPESTAPVDKEDVVLDIFDVKVDHKEGTSSSITFDFDLPADVEVDIVIRTEGEWIVIDKEDITYNADGTITVVIPSDGIIVVTVPSDFREDIPQTGDQIGSNIAIWVALLAVSAVALVAVVVLSKRKVR